MAAEHRNRPLRYLKQQIQLTSAGRRIRQHDLAPVNRVQQEFIGHKFVLTLAINSAISIIVFKEILAHKNGKIFDDASCRFNLFVHNHEGGCCFDLPSRALLVLLMLARLERKFQHRHGKHHFREIT